ncbi:MAG: hypothetical protein KatS3mg085_311 [Candidatus Dojkabacteria bacterium]|nr:MAG: hypothetical protein KatS3mg085_311 [Candidatus Dojkabacteria bacterium]
MKKIINKIHSTLIILMFVFLLHPLLFSVLVVRASGQSDFSNIICQVLPFLNNIVFVKDAICKGNEKGAENAVNTIVGLVQLGGTLVFVGIIGISIYVIIKAAIKYIRSEGEQEKVVEAQKAIKQVFAGLAALFVGLVGLVIILALINTDGTLGGSTEQNDQLQRLRDLDLGEQ